MLKDLREAMRGRVVGFRSAVVATVVTGLVLGVGGYLLGHDMGEGDAGRTEFVRQQQSEARMRMTDTTTALVKIEQQAVELLTGKSGSEVDLDAFLALRQQYTTAYNTVIAERGRVSQLYGDAVRQAARAVTTANNSELIALFPEPGQLARLTMTEMRSLVDNSITARKAQWGALRKFNQLAIAEMTGQG